MKTFPYRVFPAAAMLIVLPLMPQTGAAVAITDGLIHLWHMDETSGSSVADSVGGWDLQLQGGATLGVPGREGSGVRLDGANDFLTSLPVAANFIGSDFTLSLWVQWASAAGKPGMLQFTSNVGYRDLSIDLSYADLKPLLDANSGSLRVSSSQSIGDGRWHLLSAVRQGASGFLYLDAVQVGAGSGTLTVTGTADTFQLGKYDATHFFGGTVDEVAIYGRALSPAEIAANAVPEPGATTLFTLGAAFLLLRSVAGRCRRRRAV